MEKVEKDRHISSHDIGKELNIGKDHKTVLNQFWKRLDTKKETQCLSDLIVKNLIDRISIQIIVKTKRNRIIFETTHGQ